MYYAKKSINIIIKCKETCRIALTRPTQGSWTALCIYADLRLQFSQQVNVEIQSRLTVTSAVIRAEEAIKLTPLAYISCPRGLAQKHFQLWPAHVQWPIEAKLLNLNWCFYWWASTSNSSTARTYMDSSFASICPFLPESSLFLLSKVM